MPDFIRVKDKSTGHEYSIPEDRFDAEAADKIDKPAYDPSGDVAGPKYKTSVGKSAAAKKAQSGQKADADKETS